MPALPIDIVPSYAIKGHFKATSFQPPCWAVIHFTQLSKRNCCQPDATRLPSLPVSH